MGRTQMKAFQTFFIFFAVLFPACSAFCGAIPQQGSSLPSFQLQAPQSEDDLKYLGVGATTFELKNVKAQLLIVEILGVYCPYCYEQAPLFKKLYDRLQRKKIGDRVKMLGVAAGGTRAEVEHLRTNGSYDFPIVPDESYAVHKLLGEPRTPFTMLLSKEGKVLHAHPGIMQDIDAFFKVIEDHLK